MYLDSSLLVDQKKFEGIEKDITCPICQGVINDPFFCDKCQNNFCKKCINKWKYNNPKCPFRCISPEYVQNKFLSRIFTELLKFRCQKGCEKIISYNDVDTHYENCEKENFKEKYYECATKVEILKIQMENYNDIQNELNDTKNDLEQAQERIEELENELEQVKEDKDNYQYRAHKAEEKVEDLESELEDLDDIKCKYDNLVEKYTELEKNIKNEKENNEQLLNEVKKLKEEKKENEKNNKNFEDKIKELEKTIKSLYSKNNDLMNELSCIKVGIEKEKEKEKDNNEQL